MERRKNEIRVELVSPEAIRRARVISEAAMGKTVSWPDKRTSPEVTEKQTLSPTSSISFLRALDSVVRGQVPVSPEVRGWAIYMQNHYGRYPSPDPSGED